MYVGRASHGMGAVRFAAYFLVVFFGSVTAVYAERNAGKVSRLSSICEFFVHHVFATANRVGAVELMVVEVSQNKIIASAAMAIMRSAMSARPYSRAL